MADSIQDDHAAKVLRDIADEEVVHAGEFLAVLKKLAPNEAKLYDEGEKEVQKMSHRIGGTTMPDYHRTSIGNSKKIPLTSEQIENLKKADRELLSSFPDVKIKEVWAEKVEGDKIQVGFEVDYAWVSKSKMRAILSESGSFKGFGVNLIVVDYDKEDFEKSMTEGKLASNGQRKTLTERLDKIASEIEQSKRPDIALALDRISDKLERS